MHILFWYKSTKHFKFYIVKFISVSTNSDMWKQRQGKEKVHHLSFVLEIITSIPHTACWTKSNFPEIALFSSITLPSCIVYDLNIWDCVASFQRLTHCPAQNRVQQKSTMLSSHQHLGINDVCWEKKNHPVCLSLHFLGKSLAIYSKPQKKSFLQIAYWPTLSKGI